MKWLKMKVGIDFGGVIVKPADGNHFFDSNLGLDIEQPNAIATIAYLIAVLDVEVWIVSKASISTQKQTRAWLNLVDFYSKTNFHPANLRFCAKRSEKFDICRELEIEYFLDDTLEVLEYMEGSVPNRYLFGKESNNHEIVSVESWDEFLQRVSSKTIVMKELVSKLPVLESSYAKGLEAVMIARKGLVYHCFSSYKRFLNYYHIYL